MRKKNPTKAQLATIGLMVQYHIYDICDSMDDTPQVFLERSARLKDLWRDVNPYESAALQRVETITCSTIAEIDAYYTACMNLGYEGSMVRANALYERKRTFSLLKYKEMMDKEFVILAVHEGTGNWAGAAKKVTVDLGNGLTSNPTLRGTYAANQEILENPDKYIGKEATVIFQGYTVDGNLRFGRVKIIHMEPRI